MVFNIPLVNKIYFPVKRIFDFLFFPPKKEFKGVVLVEYPRKGIYSVGFVTNHSCKHFEDKVGKTLYNVFIPSSPSPITGFTIVVRKDELVFLNLAVDDMLKMLISGGLVNPRG